ncbi:MAG: hypothetical protein ABI824_02810 [Acidobacteriota bacterium]
MKLIIAFCCMTATVSFGQIRFLEPSLGSPNAKDLTQRVAASDYVIVGSVTKLDMAHSLTMEERVRRVLEAKDLSQDGDHAYIWTIHVDSVLCRNSDFHPENTPSRDLGKDIYLVRPMAEPETVGSQRVEFLQQNRKYLLFLHVDPKKNENSGKYHLDPAWGYYRAQGYGDGAIRLPLEAEKGDKPKGVLPESVYRAADGKDLSTPVLDATTALCAAVQPSDAFQKQVKLELLKSSTDPVMRDNAEAALKMLAPSAQR